MSFRLSVMDGISSEEGTEAGLDYMPYLVILGERIGRGKKMFRYPMCNDLCLLVQILVSGGMQCNAKDVHDLLPDAMWGITG